MTFNEKLTELRKSKGWSQEQLGEKVNVSRQTVSKWELGLTTPEMEKLIELSSIFGISIDELAGKSTPQQNDFNDKHTENTGKNSLLSLIHYEYKSKTHIGSMPLVHINTTGKAKGIVAIGIFSKGIFSLGLISLGILSTGLISLGLLAIAGLAFGGAAIGGIAVGLLAIGGFALGLLSLGGLAIGFYSMGGCAIAKNIALGGYAQGHIAIGDVTSGEFCFNTINNSMRLANSTVSELKEVIKSEFPNTLKIIQNIFSAAVK